MVTLTVGNRTVDAMADKDNEKEKYKTFEIKLNKKEKDSDKLDSTVKVFEDVTPEEFCK